MKHPSSHVLADVPKIETYEHPDVFSNALATALLYGNEEMAKRYPRGLYDALSGFTGRGWLIGFDEAYDEWPYPDGMSPHPDFAACSLDAYFRHCDTLLDAVRFTERVPEFLWNHDCTYPVDREKAADLIGAMEGVDAATLRRYVMDSLAARGRPVVVLLHLPAIPLVEMALLTGYESDGGVVLGRAPFQVGGVDSSGPHGYFRLLDWEQHVLAVLGVGEERKPEWEHHPVFVAIGNALKCAQSRTEGTRHFGLATYDAWERALLDDDAIGADGDEGIIRRLQQHSSTAGFIACQKAFTRLPEAFDGVPSMGIIPGLVNRAGAVPLMIHGLMWDAWQVVGGYWRNARTDGGVEIRRFRDRAVRERAVQVIRRARRMDAQALQELQEAKEEWEHCLGRGNTYRCPCMGRPCARV